MLILILSSLDPLLGMSVIRVVLHNNLIPFGSPASTAFHSAFRSVSRPTAVALTDQEQFDFTERHQEFAGKAQEATDILDFEDKVSD